MRVSSPSSPPSLLVSPYVLPPSSPCSDHHPLFFKPKNPSNTQRRLSIVVSATAASQSNASETTTTQPVPLLQASHPEQQPTAHDTAFDSPRSLIAEGSVEGGSMAGPHLVVFSGGTAWNSVAGSLRGFTTRVSHVLPVSDDGGSTAEIVRVVGGPAVGDIRSRCLRLADDSNQEARAVRRLLAHRLPSRDAQAARAEWYQIVEGEHPLWTGLSDPYKHTIRAFLVHFHTEILLHSSERFNFANGSIGNFFFAGARIFFHSLEAAIFLFSRVARLPEGSRVLPAIATEERITLGAQLIDGTVMRGQNEISHPSIPESPCTVVNKVVNVPPLDAPIHRIFYLSHEGTHHEHEVTPPTNKQVLVDVSAADAVVYAMGSLYTSIGPNLILQGVGEAVAAAGAAKILILNGTHDHVVEAVCSMLNRQHTRTALQHPPSAYVHTLLVPEGGAIEVDLPRLAELGVDNVVTVPSHCSDEGECFYDADALVASIASVLERGRDGQ